MSLDEFASETGYPTARRLNIEAWAPLVWDALSRMRGATDRPPLDQALVERQFYVLANQALWAVTEVSSAARWKYAAQRYFSEEVWDRWRLLQAAGKAMNMRQFLLGLRHEHVVERKPLMQALRDAQSESEVANVLHSTKSCVVTVAEDERLRAVGSTSSGWDRYLKAQPTIRVWDRMKGDWTVNWQGVFDSPEKGLVERIVEHAEALSSRVRTEDIVFIGKCLAIDDSGMSGVLRALMDDCRAYTRARVTTEMRFSDDPVVARCCQEIADFAAALLDSPVPVRLKTALFKEFNLFGYMFDREPKNYVQCCDFLKDFLERVERFKKTLASADLDFWNGSTYGGAEQVPYFRGYLNGVVRDRG